MTQRFKRCPLYLLGIAFAAGACGRPITNVQPTPNNAAIATAVAAISPTGAAVAQPTPTFAPPRSDDQSIAAVVFTPIKQSYPDTSVLVGVFGVEGDYAAVLSETFGQQPQFAWLKRNDGTWRTVFLGLTLADQRLDALGVPASLTVDSDTYRVMAAWMTKLQQEDDAALNGYIAVEAISGDYARARFEPSEPTARDGTTAFLKRTNATWSELDTGTAFDAETLTSLGVPKALWPEQ